MAWEYLIATVAPYDIYRARTTFNRPGYDALVGQLPAEWLATLGGHGWELVAAPGASPFGSWVFKRPAKEGHDDDHHH